MWKNNKNSEKETQNSNTSPDNSRGDVIIIIILIRIGAKTISLQTLFGRLNKFFLNCKYWALGPSDLRTIGQTPI